MIENILLSMPMYVSGICFLLLMLKWLSTKRKADAAISCFWLFSTFLYIGHYVFFCRVSSLLPVSDSVYCACNLAIFPSFLVYLQILTGQKKHLRLTQVMILFALFCGIIIGVLYSYMDAGEKEAFIESYLYQNEHHGFQGLIAIQIVVHILFKVFFAVTVIFTVIFGFKYIEQFNTLVDSIYADTEDKKINHITGILVLLVTTSIISFAANAIGRHMFFGSLWIEIIPSVIFSSLLLGIGHTSLHQNFSYEDMEKEGVNIATILGEVQDDKDAKPLLQAMNRLLNEDLIFLEQGLKVTDFAKRLGTNQKYIYNILHDELGLSFSEYINQKRIDYAEQLINTHPELSLQEICQKSGFSSTSSFYRNFKLFKGYTPKNNDYK